MYALEWQADLPSCWLFPPPVPLLGDTPAGPGALPMPEAAAEAGGFGGMPKR